MSEVSPEVGIQYKTNIGKLMPLSYPITEVENYIEQSGDAIDLISRNTSPSVEEDGDRGLEVIHIRTIKGKDFYVYYKQKYKQFGLFYKKQVSKDKFEFYLLKSWNILIEEGDWYDLSVPSIVSDSEKSEY